MAIKNYTSGVDVYTSLGAIQGALAGMLRACDLPSKYYGEAWLAYSCNPEEGEA